MELSASSIAPVAAAPAAAPQAAPDLGAATTQLSGAVQQLALAVTVLQLSSQVQQLGAAIQQLQTQGGVGALGAPVAAGANAAPAAMPAAAPGTIAGGPVGLPIQQVPTQTFPTQSPVQAPVGPPAKGAPTTPAVPAAPANPGGTSDWKIGSFNVLGASHTAAGGNKPQLKSGTDRVPGMVAQLKKHDVDVVGLQEFQGSQVDAFKKAKTGYDLRGGKDNYVAWKSDKYRLVKEQSIKVPYFEGKEREMPVVQLEDKATGKRAWFINIHNPADTANHHGQQKYRTEAMKRERELIANLKQSGLPVFIVGDFNEKDEARKVMTAGGLTTASDPASGKDAIDWVFGTGPVQFTGNVIDQSPKTSGVSDHPIVVANARV